MRRDIIKNYQSEIKNAEIKSVAKALSIIDFISKNDQATLQSISNGVGIPKSTAVGILKTLEQFDYINKLVGKEYELGIYLFELGNNVRKKINLDVIAKPYLEKLAEELGETVNLAILDNDEVLLLDKYKPEKIIIEQGFTRFNKSTQALFRVHGLANYIFWKYEQIYYPSTTIKKIVGGKGNIGKKQLREIIKLEHPEISFNSYDESDAFATGKTYFIEQRSYNNA